MVMEWLYFDLLQILLVIIAAVCLFAAGWLTRSYFYFWENYDD